MIRLEGADAVVLGAGFFGCEIALALRGMGFERVVLIERERAIMRRASTVNQARVHNGYHYPRSLATARSCRINAARFSEDHGYAIVRAMEMVYAIAQGSRVKPTQFERLCARIGAPCKPASRRLEQLFNPDLVEAVFQVQEFAFDAAAIAQRMAARLAAAHVDLRLGLSARVDSVSDAAVVVHTGDGPVRTRSLVNTTYAGLDSVGVRIVSPLKRELAELALIWPPREIADLGITVMDGPFFSTMPFPPAGLHSLTHVRYTPHEAWTARRGVWTAPRSNVTAMLRDSARYLPCLGTAEAVPSLFEVKAVLQRSEHDDSRPVLFEASPDSPRIVSIMGAKLDNVYDAIDAIRTYEWPA